jgi:hypothetical protein
LLGEDLTNESDIPTKSKQGLVVKKISNMLSKNPLAIIKKSLLTKQGDKVNQKVEERLLTLTAKEIKWYHDEGELKRGMRPLGVIYLSAIYHCVPANTKMDTLDFIVSYKYLNTIFISIDRNLRLEKEGPREGRSKRLYFWCERYQ